MDKIDLAKQAVRLVTGLGANRIVGSIIANQTHAPRLYQKVAVVVAGAVMSSMVSDALGEHSDAKIDEAVIWWKENVKK